MNDRILDAVTRVWFLPGLMVAIALLAGSYSGVGDGFSGGVIALLCMLLRLISGRSGRLGRIVPLAAAVWLAVGGLLAALLVVFGPVLAGAAPVTHYPEPGAQIVHLGRIEFHTALLFDVGVFLVVFGFGNAVFHAIGRLSKGGEA